MLPSKLSSGEIVPVTTWCVNPRITPQNDTKIHQSDDSGMGLSIHNS